MFYYKYVYIKLFSTRLDIIVSGSVCNLCILYSGASIPGDDDDDGGKP